jgi:hypothetical protein
MEALVVDFWECVFVLVEVQAEGELPAPSRGG